MEKKVHVTKVRYRFEYACLLSFFSCVCVCASLCLEMRMNYCFEAEYFNRYPYSFHFAGFRKGSEAPNCPLSLSSPPLHE